MIEIPLSAEEFQAKSHKLQTEQGIQLTGNQGQIERSGVKAAYEYAAGVLKVNILEKPFFVSTEYCEEQLKGWLASH